MKIAIIGAGWAGCAAAVQASDQGHQVTIFEAARIPGGRARRVHLSEEMLGNELWPNRDLRTIDNGQHILIGAYTQTLQLMRHVGINVSDSFVRKPLTLQQPNRRGLQLPDWPMPYNVLAGVMFAEGWNWRDQLSLLLAARSWRRNGFVCDAQTSVHELCASLTPNVRAWLIDPLCVSALNTPPEQASGQVFLRVLQDALFAGAGSSNLLLPRIDLSAAFPEAALAHVTAQEGKVHLGSRVTAIAPLEKTSDWLVNGQTYERLILACPPWEAARLVQGLAPISNPGVLEWLRLAQSLRFEAITTVYAYAPDIRLRQPLFVLPDPKLAAEEFTVAEGTEPLENPTPAQFVLDRGQLGGPTGLLAFVVSASQGTQDNLTRHTLVQVQKQLGLKDLQHVQTIVEKRATFACTPNLQRPGAHIAQGLLACGDYVAGPYPATLEGAVRSGLQAVSLLEAAGANPVIG